MNRLNHCLKAIYILRAFLLTSLYSPMKVSHSNSVALRTSFNLGGDPLEKKKRKKKKGGEETPNPGLLSSFCLVLSRAQLWLKVGEGLFSVLPPYLQIQPCSALQGSALSEHAGMPTGVCQRSTLSFFICEGWFPADIIVMMAHLIKLFNCSGNHYHHHRYSIIHHFGGVYWPLELIPYAY